MKYENIEYTECREVYTPAEDTFLLIDKLEVEEKMKVLEIGGATGIVSLFASQKASTVTVTDINPYAIKCIEKNIKLNNKDNIKVVKSDLFENINEKYDLILFNTPYLPVSAEEHDEDDIYQKAWDGGTDGRKVIDRFLREVGSYLEDDGKVQLVQSSLSDNKKTLDILVDRGFDAKISASIHQFFEDITLISATKK